MNAPHDAMLATLLAKYPDPRTFRAQPDHESMDETMSFEYSAIGRLSDEQIEALTNEADVSFSALLDEIDVLSDQYQPDWHAIGVLKAVRDARIADAKDALARLFVRAMEDASAPSTPKVPTVSGKRIVMEPVTMLAHEFVSCNGSTDPVLRILCASKEEVVAERARYFGEMAKEYADAYAEELLAQGWVA